ncbi:MAG TPA: helix-turn-helix transcriptional regulator [Ferruginibacter sp.]|nr:helix-turn-helix transcriptional regulator [Ferruginibacter sp.]
MKYYRDNDVLKQFGDKVRAIRLSKKMSQEDLAYECGLEYSQINRIELGKINTSISHLFLLAKALKVTPQELLFFQ